MRSRVAEVAPLWRERRTSQASFEERLRNGERMGGVQELIVDNADHNRRDDKVRVMREQIIPQLSCLPSLGKQSPNSIQQRVNHFQAIAGDWRQ